ncbi:molybdopterin-guanine dinucleotide biosynthesis protein B [Aureibacillus halotolerans]|uniref:Molybdopterin-guanine dinucleotide biosynthesis protein B n=1 Tax=Aureibacillus halotolerans TaxID=1508390 RepID=A0A4R6U3V9_9BACI|nr:molybdopterin-guanine dinucleotide biosynthesis protein B [Aureibacillus halotolerans]TDQ40741.1 molybdopterin-guanine dinucleotide biosynthesis protein B [Aureibacillus halotolerans]
MQVLQVVGYKNSGKTTLVAKLVELFTKAGHRVGALKHHGHGGQPVGWVDTDSAKQSAAGALLSGVEGDGILQLAATAWDLDTLIELYRFATIELLIVEGYKEADYPKIVLIRNQEDLPLLTSVTNCKAIVSAIPLEEKPSCAVYSYEEMDHWVASVDIAHLNRAMFAIDLLF